MSNNNNPEKTTYTRIAFFLIAIGTLMGCDSFFGLSLYKLWPVITMILGSGLIGIFIKRKTTGLLFLGTGEYLLFFSGLALYFNFTTWKNIGHLWPLFVVFMGVVFLTLYTVNRQKRALLFLGLVLISVSVFFMFALNVRYWWTIFILVGASILISVRTK